MRHRKGFSLIELMLSIVIIGTSIVLVVGIFTILVAGSQKAADITAGSTVAAGLMSQQIYQIMASDNTRNTFFQQAYSTPTSFIAGTYTLNGTVFLYNMYVQDVNLSSVTLSCPATDTGGGTKLKRFDIVITWNDASSTQNIQTTARDQGLQEVHQVRFLWPNGGY